MSGIEAIVIPCMIGANTVTNIAVQSAGLIARFWRWYRLRNQKIISVSREQNLGVFYHISRMLNDYCKNLQHKTVITFARTVEDSKIFYVQDRNAEVKLTFGKKEMWIKAVSQDGYNIIAYELTCNDNLMLVEDFMNDIIKLIKPSNEKDVIIGEDTEAVKNKAFQD